MSQEPIRFFKGTGHRDAVSFIDARHGVHHVVLSVHADGDVGCGYMDGDASYAQADRITEGLENIGSSRDMVIPGVHPYHRIPR